MHGSGNRSERTVCWLCDFWWVILLLIFLIVAAILTRNYWLPLLTAGGTAPLPQPPVSATLPPEMPTLALPTLALNTPEIQLLPTSTDSPVSGLVGQPAPLFSLEGVNGETVALADFAGRPILFVFFASWCPHCQNEAPLVQQIADQNSPRGLQVLAINITNNDSAQDAKNFVQTQGWNFPVALDHDGSVSNLYGVGGVPFHVVIDSQGVAREQRLGELDAAALQQLVDIVLAQ